MCNKLYLSKQILWSSLWYILCDIINVSFTIASFTINILNSFVLMLYLGSTTELMLDEHNILTGIYFQTHEMQEIFNRYPEVILVDSTYKLIDLGMPVFVVMAIDGNGNMFLRKLCDI